MMQRIHSVESAQEKNAPLPGLLPLLLLMAERDRDELRYPSDLTDAEWQILAPLRSVHPNRNSSHHFYDPLPIGDSRIPIKMSAKPSWEANGL
jgi:hypothetical protein